MTSGIATTAMMALCGCEHTRRRHADEVGMCKATGCDCSAFEGDGSALEPVLPVAGAPVIVVPVHPEEPDFASMFAAEVNRPAAVVELQTRREVMVGPLEVLLDQAKQSTDKRTVALADRILAEVVQLRERVTAEALKERDRAELAELEARVAAVKARLRGQAAARGDEQAGEHVCDVVIDSDDDTRCGRTFTSAQGLALHSWRAHVSPVVQAVQA